MACGDCLAPHHTDCWAFQQGCSIFGCGGHSPVPLATVEDHLQARGLTITEATRAPLRLGPVVQSLARKFTSRARFLPRTLTAGVLGACLGVGIGSLFEVDFLHKGYVFGGLLGSGALYGLLAPFLAPFQVRHPRIATGLSFLFFTSLFAVLDYLSVRGFLGGIGLAAIFSGMLLFATSASEALLGARTWAAEKLGRLSSPLRMGLTWGAFVAGFLLLAVMDAGHWPASWRWPDAQVVQDILGVSLMVAASGGTAMETGKQAFLEAVTPTRLRLPSQPHQE